jgi:hypothetical protein
MKAAFAPVAFVVMLPARWAAAAETVETTVSPLPDVGQAVDSEVPRRAPGPPARMAVDPEESQPAAPRLEIDPMMVKGASFYDVVGRPDLAAQYRTRHGFAVGSRVVGGITLGLGVTAWVAVELVDAFSKSFCIFDRTASGCSQSPPTLIPDIMMATGAVLLLAPAFWSNDPVSEREKKRLARDAESRQFDVSLAAAPSPDGRGGTVVLGGRF